MALVGHCLSVFVVLVWTIVGTDGDLPPALVKTAEAQGWVLRVEEQEEGGLEAFKFTTYFGIQFSVEFSEAVFLNRTIRLTALPPTQEHLLHGAVQLWHKGSKRFQFTPLYGVSDADYLLFLANGQFSRDVERWLSVVSGMVKNPESTLLLHAVWRDADPSITHLPQPTDFQLKFVPAWKRMEPLGNEPYCLTSSTGKPVLGSVQFVSSRPPSVTYDVIYESQVRKVLAYTPLNASDIDVSRWDAKRRSSAGKAAKVTHPSEAHNETRSFPADNHNGTAIPGQKPLMQRTFQQIDNAEHIPFDPNMEHRIQEVYTAFVQTTPNSGPLDHAFEAGWLLADHVRRGTSSMEHYTRAQSFLETAHSSGVSAGFVLFCVVQGFLPKATKKVWYPYDMKMKKKLVPAVDDALDGPKKKQAKKNPKKYGLLSIAITKDLLLAVPDMVTDVSSRYTTIIAADVYSGVVESTRADLEQQIPDAVNNMVSKTLPQTISYVVPIAIKRLLPGYLLQALANTLTNTLTRSLTHSLTQVLTHTMIRGNILERAAYKCKYFQEKKSCDISGETDQHKQWTTAALADWYASYYSDYYGWYFTKGDGVLREDRPWLDRFLEEAVGVMPYPYTNKHPVDYGPFDRE